MLAYINADIILLDDFSEAIQLVQTHASGKFLLAGQRYEINQFEPVDFSSNWQDMLKQKVAKEGKLMEPAAIDYFVFSRGLYKNIPAFAIGRPYWDNWMIKHAGEAIAPIITGTSVITAIHQNHDYGHVKGGFSRAFYGPEAKRNQALAQADFIGMERANYALTRNGLSEIDPEQAQQHAQANQLRAGTIPALIENANRSIKQQNWSSALDYLDAANRRLMGAKVPRMQYLRALCYYHLQQYEHAEQALMQEGDFNDPDMVALFQKIQQARL